MTRTPRLRPVSPPPSDERMWASVLNLLFWLERDEEFLWLQAVRAAVEEAEREKGREAA